MSKKNIKNTEDTKKEIKKDSPIKEEPNLKTENDVDILDPIIAKRKRMAKLYTKIHKVMEATNSVVEKTGKNTSQNYTYASDEDIVKHIRAELVKAKLIVLPTLQESSIREITTKTGTSNITKVRVGFMICDPETGDHVTVYFEGEGWDSTDKGIYKAYTGAKKYFLINTFMLASTDDPENEVGQSKTSINKTSSSYNSTAKKSAKLYQKAKTTSKPKIASSKQLGKIFGEADELDIEEEALKDWVYKAYNVDSMTKLTTKQASDIIEKLLKKKAERKANGPDGSEDVSPDEIPDDL